MHREEVNTFPALGRQHEQVLAHYLIKLGDAPLRADLPARQIVEQRHFLSGSCIATLRPRPGGTCCFGECHRLGFSTNFLQRDNIVALGQGREIREFLLVLRRGHPVVVIDFASVIDARIEEQVAIQRADFEVGAEDCATD